MASEASLSAASEMEDNMDMKDTEEHCCLEPAGSKGSGGVCEQRFQ